MRYEINEEKVLEVVRLLAKLQSALHSLDDIDDRATFKQEMKQRTNQYKKYIDNWVTTTTGTMNLSEGDMFIKTVANIDKLTKAEI